MQAELAAAAMFDRLEHGHAASIAVLTPNRRSSQALQKEFAARQMRRGLLAWDTPDILPIAAFVERMWEEALFHESVNETSLLLSPAQEQALWEDIIRESPIAEALLSPSAAARQCRDAWQLVHAWRLGRQLSGLDASLLNQDSKAFLGWSERYGRITAQKGYLDRARLPDRVVSLLGRPETRKPATLVLFNFNVITPQQRELIDALSKQGVEVLSCEPQRFEGRVHRIEFASSREELLAVARWAREKLEAQGTARIGIVVPDLASSRERVQRTLASIMQPDALAEAVSPSAEAKSHLFDFSLGQALADYPLVHDALLILGCAEGELAITDMSRLLCSPFIAGAEEEFAARAKLDAKLRRRCNLVVTLDQLLSLLAAEALPSAPLLAEHLLHLAQLRSSTLSGCKTAAEWAKAMDEVLREMGFGRGRALDSDEYQTLQKWHEVLASLATLETVTGEMTYAQACRRVRRLAVDTLFQPEAADVPIQVLGILESSGLNFDHLWVTGLADDAWPLPARANPFIPIALQRQAGIPQADAAASLELDRHITSGWLTAAREVVVSHARMREDSELGPSALIAGIPVLQEPRFSAYETFSDFIHRHFAEERIADGCGPPLPQAAEPWPGGTGIFKDQAACPFRAFARYRLASRPVQSPQFGLDAAERGTLLHQMLAAVWNALGSLQTLLSVGPMELEELLDRSAQEALTRAPRARAGGLHGVLLTIEKRRLKRLARAWLDVEKTRSDFFVAATESKRAITFGGLTINAKLDRMDRLPGGGHLIIDYKTGGCAVSAWLGPRPDEPQLPLYALGGHEPIVAIAFAQIKAGEMKFKGLASDEELLPGVNRINKDRSKLAQRYLDWPALTAAWRSELEALGRGFAGGDAQVDPKHAEQTCRLCDQYLFCRIAEKAPYLPEDGREGNGDG